MRAIRFYNNKPIGIKDFRVKHSDAGISCKSFQVTPAHDHLLNQIRSLPGQIFEGWFRTTTKDQALTFFIIELRKFLGIKEYKKSITTRL